MATERDPLNEEFFRQEMELEEALRFILKRQCSRWTLLCVIALSFSQAVIGLETNMLTYVAPCASIEFGGQSEAQLWYVVYAGSIVGALVLGPLADVIGRWKMVFFYSSLVSVFGIASAFSTSWGMLLLLRFVVGVGEGLASLSIDMLAEYVPTDGRGIILNWTQVGWGIGALGVNVLAQITIPTMGWRVYTGLCAVPIVFSTGMILFLVESPRFLLANGDSDAAMNSLKWIAKFNMVPVPCESLKPPVVQRQKLPPETSASAAYVTYLRESITAYASLCSRNMILRTALLTLVWFGCNFLYSGIVIFDSDVLYEDDDSSCSFEYTHLTIVSSGEVLGPLLLMPLIDHIRFGSFSGRFGSQWLPYLLCAVTTLISCVNVSPTFWAFMSRSFCSGATGVTYVAVPEHYPTTLRATATVLLYAVGLFGCIVSACWCYADLPTSTIGSGLAVVSLATIVPLCYLPETAQKSLDIVDQGNETVSGCCGNNGEGHHNGSSN